MKGGRSSEEEKLSPDVTTYKNRKSAARAGEKTAEKKEEEDLSVLPRRE